MCSCPIYEPGLFDALQLQARAALVAGDWRSAEQYISQVKRKDWFDLNVEYRALELKLADAAVARDPVACSAATARRDELVLQWADAVEGSSYATERNPNEGFLFKLFGAGEYFQRQHTTFAEQHEVTGLLLTALRFALSASARPLTIGGDMDRGAIGDSLNASCQDRSGPNELCDRVDHGFSIRGRTPASPNSALAISR